MKRIVLEEHGLVGVEHGPPEGRPLVLLHGFPDLPRGYFPMMETLGARGFRCVAPHLRGYAPSRVDGLHEFDVLAGDLLAWLDALSPDEAVDVIGHDWGSVVVQRASMLRPERFRHIGLMAVPHLLALFGNLPRHPAQLVRSRYMLHFQAGALSDALVRARGYRYIDALWRRWSPSHVMDADYARELHACFDASWPVPLDFYRVARKPGTWPSSMAWRPDPVRDAIAVPTLYLHGEADGCIGPGLTRGQERFFTGRFEQHVLEGVGHFLHVEDPERVAGLVRAFFEEESAGH